MKPDELYQRVTDSLVALMEQGTLPWRRQWADGKVRGDGSQPVNAVTRRAYNGINTLILWMAAMERGYPTNRWCTFKQAQTRGSKVRKGESGTHVVFFKRLEVEDRNNPDETKLVGMMRSFVVFNVAQLEGPLAEASETVVADPLPDHVRNELIDQFVDQCGAAVRHGGDRAFYSPSDDYIQVPTFATFHTPEAYYATVVHELGHWTGHKGRLDRLRTNARFGDAHYAYEELVAELAATFLCTELQLSPDLPNHASYLDNWLKVLKGDKKAVFKAAGDATKAATWLKKLQPGYAEYVALTGGAIDETQPIAVNE